MVSPLFRNFFNRDRGQNDPGQQGDAKSQRSRGNLVKRIGFTKSLEVAVRAAAEKSLGLLAKMLGKDVIDKQVAQELENTTSFLEQLGYRMTPPVIPPTREPVYINTAHRREDEEFQEWQEQIEGPYLVESSNVYSIAYEWNMKDVMSPGNLLVQFLGGTGKSRSGPGATYRYHGVRHELFEEFRRAASKGGWVWDELRVRGTISGHQYPFDLAGIDDKGYIPRAASLKRGHVGEYFVKRRFMGGESQKEERQVRGPRGPLPGFDKAHKLDFRAGRRNK